MKTLAIGQNPVLRRELLERWRGRRAVLVVTAYVAVLSAFTMLLAWIGTETLSTNFGFDGGIAGAGPLLGRFLVHNLLAVTLGLALLLAPAYAAGQIAGERERKTLSLLRITLVRPRAIVTGKLGAALAWLVLLIVAAVPLMALGFFLGGVTMPELGKGLFTLLAITISVAAIGIGISSMTKRSTPALIVTILTVGVLVIGTLFAALVESIARDLDDGGFNQTPVTILANPFVAMADAVGADESDLFGGNRLPSILTPFGSALPRDDVFFGGGVMMEDFAMAEEAFIDNGFGGQPAIFDGPRVIDVEERAAGGTPYWFLASLFYLAMGALALLVASRRVARKVEE